MELYACIVVAIVFGFLLGRLFSRLNASHFMLVRGEKSRITFDEKGGSPLAKLGFETEIFNLIGGRRALGWRRFADDEHNKDLARALKAWEYKAWLGFGLGSRMRLEAVLSKKRGLMLYLPRWRTLWRGKFTVCEEFTVPLVEGERLSGAIAALKTGGAQFASVIKTSDVSTLSAQDFVFTWRRVRKQNSQGRAAHNADKRALGYRHRHGGWGKDGEDDPLKHPPSPRQGAEDHPIIKAARHRLKQPRR